MQFKKFKQVIEQHLTEMSVFDLFRVNTDRSDLWTIYLQSFPDGTNPIYKERTVHDCQCCKQFIRNIGDIVYIKDNKIVSVWDVKIDNFFQQVTDELSKYVHNYYIKEPYLHYEKHVGTDHNHQASDDGTIKRWDHFHFELPDFCVRDKVKIPSIIGGAVDDKTVLLRALNEISIEAVETVLELIEQGSLYRGDENKPAIETLLSAKKDYIDMPDDNRHNFAWAKATELGAKSRVRNTAIGTLLIDLSDGLPLDDAVSKFESMVAPMNYKRPTALITKSMISNAEKKVAELGIQDSLQRRYAVMDDIAITNVLFADRLVKKAKNVFDDLSASIPDTGKNFDKVEEVSADTFINEILPKSTNIEVMLKNSHTSNLVSLVAPENAESKPVLKWGNNFSWSYNGEVTDSIKERVKKAGGNVEGVLRCSLSWFNTDDLDIHIHEPNGNHIEFSKAGRTFPSSGVLDVDMNVKNPVRNAVENITWSNESLMQEGYYILLVHNYTKRDTADVGFTVEMEYDGKIYTFNYDKTVRDKEFVKVVRFSFFKAKGVRIMESLPSSESSKQIWNINSGKFHKVTMVMNSPNHWDGNKTGNKHLFFMLDKCNNGTKTRGLYNEFLDASLLEHRKVFEVLGSKMKVSESDDQLSGLGFSLTQRNTLLCKVAGAFNRTIKINF